MEDLASGLGKLLGNGDTLDQLRSVISALGLGQNSAPAAEEPPAAPAASPSSGLGSLDFSALLGLLGSEKKGEPEHGNSSGSLDPSMIAKIMQMLGAMNQSDRNTELLRALAPFCDDHRKKRVEEAAQVMRIIKLLPLLEGGKKEE